MTSARDHMASCSSLASAMALISLSPEGPKPPHDSTANGSCSRLCRSDTLAYFLFFFDSWCFAEPSVARPCPLLTAPGARG